MLRQHFTRAVGAGETLDADERLRCLARIEEHRKELMRMVAEKQVEHIRLYEVLNVAGALQNANGRKTHVLAFDVDRFYGAIYIITSNYMFFRIEQVGEGLVESHNADYKAFDNLFSVHRWRLTHQASLRDEAVLPAGLPLGLYCIKYDSVSGRVIIADNYKIQALYI